MFFGWRVVGGTALAQLFVIGFFTYAVSLMVTPVRAEFGVSLEQVMYSLTLATLIGLFLMPIAGAMVDRYPIRWLMTIGALGYAGGLWALAQVGSITAYIIVFALTMAFSNAFAGTLPSNAVISRWFTHSRGRALGISAIGTSIGGIALPALLTVWIADHGWRVALENLALAVALILVPLVWWSIRGKPQDIGLHPEGYSQADQADVVPEKVLLAADILRHPAFWLIALSLGLLFSTYGAIMANLTPYATSLGRSEAHASSLIMTIAVTGLLGKILFGMAADKFSLKAGLWTAQGLVAIAFLMLSGEPGYTGMLLACAIMGLAAGGMLPVWGAMLAQVFGVSSFGRVMGMMGPVLTLTIMPGYAAVGRIVDATGNYTLCLQIFAGILVIAALLLLPLRLNRAD